MRKLCGRETTRRATASWRQIRRGPCRHSRKLTPITSRHWPPRTRPTPCCRRHSCNSIVIDAKKAAGVRSIGGGTRGARGGATQCWLHRIACADRWRHRQPQLPAPAPTRVWVRSFCPSYRRAASGWMPISRRTSWPASCPACQPRWSRTCCPTRRSTARSPAWRRRPERSSACCRRKMPPATSPRSCSGFRCASCWTAMLRALGRLRPGLSVTVSVDERDKIP